MTHTREMLNAVTTLGGAFIGRSAVRHFAGHHANTVPWAIAQVLAGVTGAYAGNLAFNGPDAQELKDQIRDKTLTKLTHSGVALDKAEAAFEAHYDGAEGIKPGIIRNVANVITTNIGAGFGHYAGLLTTTALTTSMGRGIDYLRGGGNKNASYGFVVGMLAGPIIGQLGGGYLGNKFFNNPSSKIIKKKSDAIASAILKERQSLENASFEQRLLAQRQMQADKGEVTR